MPIGYKRPFTPGEILFEYRDQEYKISLLGRHQIINAVLALTVIEVLLQQGIAISQQAMIEGLRSTGWSGRFEIIARKPTFIIDGAHNEDAARKLAEAIKELYSDRRIIYIMGVFADKDYHRILELTAPLADTIITLTSSNSRALSSEHLAMEAQKFCPAVFDAKTTEQAVRLAYASSKEEDVIIAFGSLSFLGEIKKLVTASWDSNSED